MATVVEHKPGNVMVGVLDKNVQLHEWLQSVTFKDVFDTLHTVFAHKDGPFQTAEEIVQAFYDGTLHTFKSHEAAAQYARDNTGTDPHEIAGNRAFAERLDKLTSGGEQPAGEQSRQQDAGPDEQSGNEGRL